MQDFTNFNPNAQNRGNASELALTAEAVFFQKVYAWMFMALLLTAGLGWMLSTSQAWLQLMLNVGLVRWGVALAPLILTLYLSARLAHLSSTAIRGFLLAIAAFFGATLSIIFLVYPTEALIKAFVCTAGIYGAMAAYGLVTKRSLQALGSFLYMGVWGLIIASVVNLFVASGPMDFVICVIGVLVFAGLTAYDHQKLRVLHFSAVRDGVGDEDLTRFALMGSLTLYLDFINLFLFLLRLFGRSEN